MNGLGSLFTLAAAGIAVAALAYWTSRLVGAWHWRQSSGRRLRVLEGVPLGRDRGLFLVALGQQVLVVGVGPGGVQLLHVVEDPALLADPPAGPGGPGPGSPLDELEAGVRAGLDRLRHLLARGGGDG